LTEKIFHTDSYWHKFEAKIVKRGEINGRPALVLDRTAFYPTSGGQKHDRGTIGNVRVIDVLIRDDEIWHLCDGAVDEERITADVDWQRRFDFMQQHTGFHLLAQSFLRVLSADTLSSHLGEELSTIDVQLESASAAQLDEVENLCNRVIWENRPVRSFFVD
jgi:alanyl-tRNA synthetase